MPMVKDLEGTSTTSTRTLVWSSLICLDVSAEPRLIEGDDKEMVCC